MSMEEYLVKAKPAPDLKIPASSSTCTVRVIDSTSRVGFSTGLAVVPHIKGHDYINCPAYAFLITNHTTKRHILFDLGVRKDWEKAYPTWLLDMIKSAPFEVKVEKDVADILDEDTTGVNVKRGDIDTVVWSHHHWDHTGDMSTFPPSTTLAVGPGLPGEMMPGFPQNPDAPFLESDIHNRPIHEFDFHSESAGLKLGPFSAIDFFSDGSFYILDTPGHTTGHICGLARTSTSPDTFVFMGGDASHHPGEFRASEYVPLPANIDPSPIAGLSAGCPGGMLQSMQRNKRADEAFYVPSDGFNKDSDVALETIKGLQMFDAQEEVLMVVAHDTSLLDTLPFYPESVNGWYERKIGRKAHWRFLRDFEGAVER